MHPALPRTSVTDVRFAADVRRGLARRDKRLSCTWLYDAIGSQLFEEICALPEYYLTRAEREILVRRAPEIVSGFSPGVSLVELGAGSAVKTAWLIDAFLAAHGRLSYLPIDVSRSMLKQACAELALGRPGLAIRPIAAEYQIGLRQLQREAGRLKLILWLGSSIGNFAPREAAAFLRGLRRMMTGQDRLLVGIDLRKERQTLERAYDDRRGVTARFNLNLLARINRELGGHFDLTRFRHRAIFDERAGCVTMSLISQGAQQVTIDRLRLRVALADGEAIETERSYKYRPGEIDALGRTAGLLLVERWLDRRRRFSLNLFRRCPA